MTAIYLQRMRHAPIFRNITDEAWAAIEPLMQYRSFNAGEFLLRGGEPAIYSFWLMSGVCREYFITLEGTQHNKSFVFAGDIAGSLYDLNSGEPSTVSIEFLESSDGFLMDFRKFTTLRSQFPCWNVWHLQMAEALFMKKARREYELLTLNATQRYQQFLRQYPGVDLQVPLYHIASYLGMTPEALSRVRKKLSLI
ncbi:Crp/Fnr family transcriptional regulator [Ketobacter alkanivorans]|uniref:Crp/Fnr family transcriptional regulator n=1 Tax=Ketobacter alkanivorans TaxID=1917421 RepID=UPI001315A5D9|nr:Crp/Fnr family transcriptional regulator [Ketobacter alkanivorans]